VCFNLKLCQAFAESFNFKAVLVVFCMWSFVESSISELCCCFVQEFYKSAVMAWNLEENSQTVSELQQFTNSNKMDMSSFFRSQSESPNVFEKKPPNVFDEKTIHLVIHNLHQMSLTKEDIPWFTDQLSMDSLSMYHDGSACLWIELWNMSRQLWGDWWSVGAHKCSYWHVL
jgi:hypothetical protein